MTVPEEEATANYVPAAAVIRRGQALSGFTGCKGCVGGKRCPELLGVKRAQADWSVCLKSSGLNPVMGWKLPI